MKARWPSTKRLIACMWKTAQRRIGCFPADEDTILAYLEGLALNASAKHVRKSFSVIKEHHEVAGFTHLSSPELRIIVNRIAANARGTIIMPQLIDKDELRRTVEVTGTGRLTGARDCFILTAFTTTWLTVEQWVTLDIEDLEPWGESGILVHARGCHPREAIIPRIDHDEQLCPVRALNRYLRRLGVSEGPLLQSIKRSGRSFGRRMTTFGVEVTVRKRLRAAGVYRFGMGAGTLRESGVMAAVRRGVEREIIEAHAGWMYYDTYRRTLERARLYGPLDTTDL